MWDKCSRLNCENNFQVNILFVCLAPLFLFEIKTSNRKWLEWVSSSVLYWIAFVGIVYWRCVYYKGSSLVDLSCVSNYPSFYQQEKKLKSIHSTSFPILDVCVTLINCAGKLVKYIAHCNHKFETTKRKKKQEKKKKNEWMRFIVHRNNTFGLKAVWCLFICYKENFPQNKD